MKMLLLSMLLIHLVLQLWLISVNLPLCTLAYAHKHSIIHDPAARRRVQHWLPALREHYVRSHGARMRASGAKRSARGAARRHTILHARGARRRNEILDSRACQLSPRIRQTRSDG